MVVLLVTTLLGMLVAVVVSMAAIAWECYTGQCFSSGVGRCRSAVGAPNRSHSHEQLLK